jgi:hypothetical protein
MRYYPGCTTDPKWMKEFVELLAKGIASTPAEFHEPLCRDFRIPPKMVQEALSQQITSEGK